MDCDVFADIELDAILTGGTSISWTLDGNFVEQNPGPYTFCAYWARSGSDEWTPVSTVPIINGCFIVDPTQHNWGKEPDVYYKVRVTLPDGSYFISPPVKPEACMDKHTWLLARDIIRKEYLNLRKNTGTQGWLLKRRNWGQKCTRCIDQDTEEIQAGHCPVCFGTGIVGGYYPAIEYYVQADFQPRRRARNPQTNFTVAPDKAGRRAVAYPYVVTNDLWVEDCTDKRFVIQTIHEISAMKGVPLIVSLELRLAPVSDIIYQVPLEGAPSSSSSSSSEHSSSGSSEQPEECLTGGLDEIEDW